MPELPEVETTVRGLAPVLQGARIARVELRRPDLRKPFPEGLGQRLTGAVVTRLWRRAKYGLIDTDRDDTLIFHLGMSGRWRIDPDRLDRHDHLLIETAAGRRLALNDARRFGFVDLVPSAALDDYPGFVGMGPEPLPAIDPAVLRARLAGKASAIKLALLDQRVIAGLGNIYVCEALWRARIAPGRKAGSIGRARVAALAAAIPGVLAEAVAAGGSSLRDYAQPDGQLGYFSTRFDVYGREGAPCRRGCGTIRRRVQGGRSTFYCPTCQR
ncbi:bifunctional DNA-formamidopyrimidine glycosylase/DNA-(apurinic or apyrimidinic site) lyase [Sphingomicrobium astaxanthinifaciens]|uniref:bifunctional DNA-formamidopyrimidine glycosylase/DNA-(apurinic or apyrimidinic site) lyase n=1 Tax=Sphingomicrobium astaxanthinifaciens TaxID=1227949 RepID=UPI001FCB0549|nr:bifunctional DNA-formamidopyrimidine glycosylase/DNA-(apurinic or apyrimidinic site) lyase [Sphingomicrobium astaxanthinifaciens]MCJ7422110.1 bifunctional DNA-formamidopyrimidine glycosylase/DNA-(apurinic or apyrimidinic site) lyase [Sphingomicrobium astaxanthinifaciens]